MILACLQFHNLFYQTRTFRSVFSLSIYFSICGMHFVCFLWIVLGNIEPPVVFNSKWIGKIAMASRQTILDVFHLHFHFFFYFIHFCKSQFIVKLMHSMSSYFSSYSPYGFIYCGAFWVCRMMHTDRWFIVKVDSFMQTEHWSHFFGSKQKKRLENLRVR